MRAIAEWSPRALARAAGVFQLLEGATSAFGQVYVFGQVVVRDDPTATASRILEQESLLRFGSAAAVVAVAFHLAWGVLLHELLAPVDRVLARWTLGVLFVGSAIQAVAALLLYAPLLVLTNAGPFAAFSQEQLQALAYLLLRLDGHVFDVFLVLFGLWLALLGWLILRSTFLPRILGALLMVSGAGWMLNLAPPLAHALFPVIAAASGLGEIPLMLWFLVKGVDAARWREQAGAGR